MKAALQALGVVLFVMAVLAAVAGSWFWTGAQSAIHQIQALVAWGTAAVCVTGCVCGLGLAEVVDVLERGIERQMARRGDGP